MSSRSKSHKKPKGHNHQPPPKSGNRPLMIAAAVAAAIILALILFRRKPEAPVQEPASPPVRSSAETIEDTAVSPREWLRRAEAVSAHFHDVYTPCWEGAYGAIGDAYLFAATHDSSLLRFHLSTHDLRAMCEGTWVDDRAWVCLAEFAWWDVTGRVNSALVEDAERRYLAARAEGRLSTAEEFWSWYNWPPRSPVRERIFTNSNMNQMVSVACWLYEATHDRRFLDDALLVWNGDGKMGGIEKTWYRGNGRWEGSQGAAAFGNPLPWMGAGYCSVAASLYRETREAKYRDIAVATAKRLLDPATGWVDPHWFYQLHMDGNGAFINFLIDAYMIAPKELPEVPTCVEKMLEHVWSNAGGAATVTLHREGDNGIRNGWNPSGGEDGYGVDEVGTVHAQGEAARAFGLFAYVISGMPPLPRGGPRR